MENKKENSHQSKESLGSEYLQFSGELLTEDVNAVDRQEVRLKNLQLIVRVINKLLPQGGNQGPKSETAQNLIGAIEEAFEKDPKIEENKRWMVDTDKDVFREIIHALKLGNTDVLQAAKESIEQEIFENKTFPTDVVQQKYPGQKFSQSVSRVLRSSNPIKKGTDGPQKTEIKFYNN
jgi:hypothetical protein